MRSIRIHRAIGLALLTVALTASPALASGGSGGGGGGGGGGGSTSSGGGGGSTSTAPTDTTASNSTPCIQFNNLSVQADQSVLTDGAWVWADYTVSRCGGNNPSFTVLTTADDAAGNRVLSATDTWYPTKSLPFGWAHSTDTAAFGTAYKVTVSVIVPETGAVVASQSRTVSTPAARIATCATVANLGGTAGYYPNNTSVGALWLSWTARNCGGRDLLDVNMRVTDHDTGQVVAYYPEMYIMPGNTTAGTGLMDIEPVPAGTTYDVDVQVRHHSDDTLLDDRTIVLTTPPAK